MKIISSGKTQFSMVVVIVSVFILDIEKIIMPYRHSQLRFQRTDDLCIRMLMGRILLINKTGTDSSNAGFSDGHLTIDELGL